jgi:hypothetical protein
MSGARRSASALKGVTGSVNDGLLVAHGVVAIVALAIGIGALVFLHVAPTGYSPVRDAVSDYGIGRFAWGYRTQVVAIGVAAAIEAGGFVHDGTAGTAGIGWLVVYAVSRVAIAWAPTDLPDAQRTRTGRVHAILAIAAFTAIAVSTSSIPNDLRGVSSWDSWADPLNTLGTVVVVTAVATAIAIVVRPLRGVFGLVERLLYVASLAWLLTAAVAFVAIGS